MKRPLYLVGLLIALFAIVFVLFRFTPLGATLLWDVSAGGSLLLPIILVAALTDSINPCAFSILLVTIGVVLSISQLRRRVLAVGGAYVLGIFGAYLAIGLGLFGALHLFDTPHFMAKIGAGLLLALGLINIINVLYPTFPIKLQIPHRVHRRMAGLIERGSIPLAVLLGVLVGLCEFPCTGGPYLTAIGLLHDQRTYLQGVGYLVAYNAVFVLPLVLTLLLAGNRTIVARLTQWHHAHKRTTRLVIGLIMLVLAGVILLL